MTREEAAFVRRAIDAARANGARRRATLPDGSEVIAAPVGHGSRINWRLVDVNKRLVDKGTYEIATGVRGHTAATARQLGPGGSNNGADDDA